MKKRLLCLTTFAFGSTALFAQDGPPRGGPGGRFMRPSAVFQAIDADGDGTLSAAEIANAAAALRKLDTNGDKQLSMEEIRPNFGPMGEGPRREGGGGGEGGGNANAASDLVKTLMSFDANGDGKLTKDEVPERMQGIFARGDANNDGVLTKEEIQTMAQAQARTAGGGGEGPRGEGGRGPGGFMRMDPVMAALDTDGDGVISESELRNAPASLKKLDKNNDGQITTDEVRPNFGPGGRGGFGGGGMNPEEMAGRMFSQFDANNDGKLSKSEVPERMQEMFERMDEDKDGFVSREELGKFMQQGMGSGGGDRRQRSGRPEQE